VNGCIEVALSQVNKQMTAPFPKFPGVRVLAAPSLPTFYPKWLATPLHALTIQQKIGLGYVLALGIAVGGTLTGLAIGNAYYREIDHHRRVVQNERQLLTKLRVTLLEFNPVQEYGSFLHHQEAFKAAKLKGLLRVDRTVDLIITAKFAALTSPVQSLAPTLEKYDRTLTEMVSYYERLLQAAVPLTAKPGTFPALQRQFWALQTAEEFERLNHFIADLEDVIKAAEAQEADAEIALQRAGSLRTQIILLSMMVSVLMATGLVLYTSRAIAQPIQLVTQVAQQVTQNDDFDLKVPVTSDNEVGILATALNQLIDRVKTLLEQQRLEAIRQVQSEKLSSLGQMVAGVAHEINNPVTFIQGNLGFTKGYCDDLLALLSAYEAQLPAAEIANMAATIDLDFLKADLPQTLQSMTVGADRMQQIALSLKNFARLEATVAHPVDLHDCLESTLLILNHALKQGITVVRHYGDLPMIAGYSGSLYQVFMNLLNNAIQALEEKKRSDKGAELTAPPEIVITTAGFAREVTIMIADNGPGIAPADQAKIFDAFFTTKQIGVGTGLGLSISWQIITEKHGGQLTCSSALGQGTTFTITLPIHQPNYAAI
jgi:two-component system, NtrC family, sensor kinase